MVARFFSVQEEGLHLKVVHNGKTENIWPLSNGKFLVPLGTTNAHMIQFNTSEDSDAVPAVCRISTVASN